MTQPICFQAQRYRHRSKFCTAHGITFRVSENYQRMNFTGLIWRQLTLCKFDSVWFINRVIGLPVRKDQKGKKFLRIYKIYRSPWLKPKKLIFRLAFLVLFQHALSGSFAYGIV
jgi:hypothetical protein